MARKTDKHGKENEENVVASRSVRSKKKVQIKGKGLND